MNITGSPDYGGRVRIVGDPGSGCSGDIYRQFNAAAFQGPLPNSDGLESGAGYMGGCFPTCSTPPSRATSAWSARNLQVRFDMFNALNRRASRARLR